MHTRTNEIMSALPTALGARVSQAKFFILNLDFSVLLECNVVERSSTEWEYHKSCRNEKQVKAGVYTLSNLYKLVKLSCCNWKKCVLKL